MSGRLDSPLYGCLIPPSRRRKLFEPPPRGGKRLFMKSFRALLGILLCGLAVSLWAQTDTARLTGTITDASGAVVSGASITVNNQGTQRVVSAQNDAVSSYAVAAMPPGRYPGQAIPSRVHSVTHVIS